LVTADKNGLGSTANRTRKNTHTERNTGKPNPFALPTAIGDFTTENLRPWDLKRNSGDLPEPDNLNSSISPKSKSSSRRKGLIMNTRSFCIATLLAGFLWTACAGRAAV
jgi:hypothetical protein